MTPEAGKILDLAARRRILAAIEAHPGLHLRGLSEHLSMPLSTLEYHCFQLEKHGHLTVRQDGGMKAFFVAEGLDRRDKDVLYVLRHAMPRRIVAHLLLHPGSTPKEIREAFGLPPATLSFHLRRLRSSGLMREEPAGRTKRLFVEDAERVASVLVTHRRGFLDDAVDRFAETWLSLH